MFAFYTKRRSDAAALAFFLGRITTITVPFLGKTFLLDLLRRPTALQSAPMPEGRCTPGHP